MPKAFTPRERELIAARLLEQGQRFFSIYGLKKTNIEDIAKAAGISKGAFYRFYSSKEELFVDVIEQAEIRLRQAIFAMIDLPGPTPRARLLALFTRGFRSIREIPILHFVTAGDMEMLFERVPAEKIRAHTDSDRVFLDELIARCQKAGIRIQVPPEQIVAMLYPLVMAVLHENELNPNALDGNIAALLELVAAYCLGEVTLQQSLT